MSINYAHINNDTRLVLNIPAARAERDRLQALLKEHEAKVEAGVQQRQRVVRITATTTQWRRGSNEKIVRTLVTEKGVRVADDTVTVLLKHPAMETRTARHKSRKTSWSKPWTKEEYGLVKDKLSIEQKYYAMETVVAALKGDPDDEVVIKTQMRQGINRRWNATSFWPQAVAGDSSTVVEPEEPATIDPETGEEEEGVTRRVRTARGRLFGVLSRDRWQFYPRETLAGVDVSSSQWQIYSILLNDTVLEQNLASWAVMRGVTLKELQELLGHSSLAMTMRYAHLAPEHLRTAVSRLEGLTSIEPTKVLAQELAQEPVETEGASQKSSK